MTKKKKLDENQIWALIMVIIPVVILMNAGAELTEHSGLRTVYSGVFGGLGGLIGFLGYFLTRNKDRLVKILTTIIIIAISGFTVYFLSLKSADSEILNQEWIAQKIGIIEFDSPTKLELDTSEIRDSIQMFYDEFILYSDHNKERKTYFLQTKNFDITHPLNMVFMKDLVVLLKPLEVSISEINLESFEGDENECSSMFSFMLKKERVRGYGFMYRNEETLESIWLIPVKRGFSRKYIEEFAIGIFPEYE